jgi:hypothetical protein
MHLSQELRAFLKGRLSSADQVEIVALLVRTPERSWTTLEVAEALRMAPESTAMRLFLLASSGLIAFEPGGIPRYRYLAADETTDRLMHELVGTYDQNRAEVLSAIGVPVEADPIRSFADAFRLKK